MLLAVTNDWFWNMQDSEWDFGVFSGIEGAEKPDPEIFKIAVKAAGNICPEQILHIGDNLRKDYQPARSLGMHALLIDRFSTPEAHTAKETGVPVVADLLEAQEYITSMEDQIAISWWFEDLTCSQKHNCKVTQLLSNPMNAKVVGHTSAGAFHEMIASHL